MKHEPIFNWDENSGTASCILTDGQKVFTGFGHINVIQKTWICPAKKLDVKLLLEELKLMF